MPPLRGDEEEIRAAHWIRIAEWLMSDLGRSRINAKMINETLERYGKVPLSHILMWPEMRRYEVEKCGIADLSQALRKSPNLEVTGPPYFLAPTTLVPRSEVETPKGPKELEGKIQARRESMGTWTTTALMKACAECQIDRSRIEAADDSDDPKEELIDLLIAAESARAGGELAVMYLNFSPPDGISVSQYRPRFSNDVMFHNRRATLSLLEIKRMDPDILCITGLSHYEGVWEEGLRAIGYEGIFVPHYHKDYPEGFQEPPKSYCLRPSDGCGIWVRSGVLKLGEVDHKRFGDMNKKYKDSAARLLAVEVLNCKEGTSVMTVFTSKLPSGGKDEDEKQRMAQTKAWGHFAKGFKHELPGKKKDVPSLVCGDLGASMQSPAGSGERSEVLRTLCDSLNVSSAYGRVGEEPSYTFIDDKLRVCRDCILVSPNMYPRSTWPVPELTDSNALPSLRYPSFHMALGARLIIGHI